MEVINYWNLLKIRVKIILNLSTLQFNSLRSSRGSSISCKSCLMKRKLQVRITALHTLRGHIKKKKKKKN